MQIWTNPSKINFMLYYISKIIWLGMIHVLRIEWIHLDLVKWILNMPTKELHYSTEYRHAKPNWESHSTRRVSIGLSMSVCFFNINQKLHYFLGIIRAKCQINLNIRIRIRIYYKLSRSLLKVELMAFLIFQKIDQ